MIQLDQGLGKSAQVIADHRQDYQDALAFYGNSAVQHAIATGYWYWRNALVGSPVRYHGNGRRDFYLAPDNFYSPPTQVTCGDTSGADAESRPEPIRPRHRCRPSPPWRRAIAAILGAFQGKGEYADGAALRLGTTDTTSAGPGRRLSGGGRDRPLPSWAASAAAIRGRTRASSCAAAGRRHGSAPLRRRRHPRSRGTTGLPFRRDHHQTARRAVPSASAQDELQWTIESGLSPEFPPGLPILPNGYFRLKNIKTSKYLAWQWPTDPAKLKSVLFRADRRRPPEPCAPTPCSRGCWRVDRRSARPGIAEAGERGGELVEDGRVVDGGGHRVGLAVGDLADGAAEDLARAGLGQPRHHRGVFEGGDRADRVAHPGDQLGDDLLSGRSTPAFNTTKPSGNWPLISSKAPTTQHSATSGWPASTSSMPPVESRWPATLMMSSTRPIT